MQRLADAPQSEAIWYLRLYVAGQSPKSLRAFSNLTVLCEQHLAGRYEIEVVDLVEHPSLASSDDIIAIPTLVRRLPAPLRKIIGTLLLELHLPGRYGLAVVNLSDDAATTLRHGVLATPTLVKHRRPRRIAARLAYGRPRDRAGRGAGRDR